MRGTVAFSLTLAARRGIIHDRYAAIYAASMQLEKRIHVSEFQKWACAGAVNRDGL